MSGFRVFGAPRPQKQARPNRVGYALRGNRGAQAATAVLATLALIALFADFIAYNKPLYAQYQGETYYPLFNDYAAAVGLYTWSPELINADWRQLQLQADLWPPVAYIGKEIDPFNALMTAPGAEQALPDSHFRHYLGTDEDGHDVLAGLIHGARISLAVGLVAAGISALVGILLGGLAGYLGDHSIRLPRVQLVLQSLGGILGFYYGFWLRSYTLSTALATGIGTLLGELLLSLLVFFALLLGLGNFWRFFRWPTWFQTPVYVPLDLVLSRVMELVVSLPIILVIITLAGIAERSLVLVMVIIGLTTWTRIARLTRAEMLKIRTLPYIEAGRALGLPETHVLLRHALPNGLAPALVAVAFAVANAILIESALSFLNIGVPAETQTWGKLLNAAQDDPTAWWLVIFPGMCIFLTVTALNLLGEALRDALDPRLLR